MPRRCSGSFSEETIRQIRKQQNEHVPVLMGMHERCGRNVRGGKRTGDKR